ncbi:hypothetical protein LCGC14_2033500 [marine sediment metagenome]|uniref:Glycosyl hydrolase family 32 N-terminal domain-containing protein n=1 Tax=marine sediment metagenome TaxID=412755 RepID=A0A0F9ETX3_9ZZZZ
MNVVRFHRLSLAAFSLLLCMGHARLCSAAEAANVEFQNDRHLLLDSRIVKSTENAALKIGTVEKSKANPLFVEDKPWEPYYDNGYPDVVYDDKEKIYKCWYDLFTDAPSATGMTLEEMQSKKFPDFIGGYATAYATSKDGIHWEKPELGLVEFKGSKKNNLLWVDGPIGVGVFRDLHDPDPARRYKAVFRTSGAEDSLSYKVSADGVHWSESIPYNLKMRADTHNNVLGSNTWEICNNHSRNGERVWTSGRADRERRFCRMDSRQNGDAASSCPT